MLFIHPYKIEFFGFFVYLLYNDVYFEYTQRFEKDETAKELKEFIFENY